MKRSPSDIFWTLTLPRTDIIPYIQKFFSVCPQLMQPASTQKNGQERSTIRFPKTSYLKYSEQIEKNAISWYADGKMTHERNKPPSSLVAKMLRASYNFWPGNKFYFLEYLAPDTFGMPQ